MYELNIGLYVESSTATMSSSFSIDGFMGSNAIDNKNNTIAHTGYSVSPWLRIDLPISLCIKGVQILNRCDNPSK